MAVGRVVRPHGVRGEIEVAPLAGTPDRITAGTRLFLSPADATPGEVRIEHVRAKKDHLLVTLSGVTDRAHADALKGKFLTLPREELPPLEPGRYYHFELVGLRVVTTEGRWLGILEEVIETGANDVYVVRGGGKEVLVPALASVVSCVDVGKGQMTVRPVPGLIPGAINED